MAYDVLARIETRRGAQIGTIAIASNLETFERALRRGRDFIYMSSWHQATCKATVIISEVGGPESKEVHRLDYHTFDYAR